MCRIFAGQDPARYSPETRRIRLNRQSTSIKLEHAFWDILEEMAAAEQLSVPGFVSKLHDEVLSLIGEPSNFTSLLRCTCLIYIDNRDKAVPSRIAAE